MKKRPHRTDPAEISITVAGHEITGSYTICDGMIEVSMDNGGYKTARASPAGNEGLARIILSELFAESSRPPA
jgi:hypothetical protein